MTDQTIIITGTSRGLGAAAARIAAEMGARVVLNARSEDTLAAVADGIRDAGGDAVAVPGDISQPEISRQLVDAAVGHFGGVDALINNAGVVEPVASIAEAEVGAWQAALGINVMGPFLLTQAALPHLRERKGRVINVTSGAADRARRGWSAYGTSKAALNHLNNVVAAEEPDVTAIAVRPGLIDSEMQAVIREHGAAGMAAEDHARFLRYHAQGDLRPPEDAGRALAVLAMHAPLEWSGSVVSWDDQSVQKLVQKHSR